MKHNLLLVEDNSHKRDRIVGFLREFFSEWKISEANSFTEASRAVLEQNFKVILMDMSLPTYVKTGNDSGGRFRTFGGREIARKVLRRGTRTKILFVTQYEAFSDQGSSKSFDDIDGEMKVEYGLIYAGLVHYDGSKTTWKDKISVVLEEVASENTDN